MKNSVVIKGNNYGIVLVLDASISFEQLKISVASKFREASAFFGEKSVAVSFEGRILSKDEECEILEIISENSQLDILCVADLDKKREENFRHVVENNTIATELVSGNTDFHKGTLRSGQEMKSDGSIVILGDVNPGATIVAEDSVVVLGSLKGTVFAGASGNTAFVVALEMEPMQIRIGDVIARSGDNSVKKEKNFEAKIAFLENGNIYIEKLTKELLNEI